jgi:hypothetical protein
VLPSLFLGTSCDAVTDLGVVIDGRLRFDCQVTKMCSTVYATLHRLRLLTFLTPERVRLKLCKALFLPYFFYCDVVFSHSRRLEVASNSCTRYEFNLRHNDHLSTRRNELLGVLLFDYYDFRVFSFSFKLIKM